MGISLSDAAVSPFHFCYFSRRWEWDQRSEGAAAQAQPLVSASKKSARLVRRRGFGWRHTGCQLARFSLPLEPRLKAQRSISETLFWKVPDGSAGIRRDGRS